MIPTTRFEDDYFIDRDTVLGKGQYGVVYPCTSKKEPLKKLCVKIITNQPGAEKKLIDREMKILRSLTNTNNPYLVRLEEIYDESEDIKIVMEKCDYGDLQKLIREKQQKNEKFTAAEVLTFVGSMVNGYYELYQRNIIHRDLKPANILIQSTRDGYIYKISDFGMSRVIDDVRKRLRLSKVGSPAYAAPQLFLEDTFSTKADVYSLGVIIYQMVFQRFPFDGFQMKDINNFFQQLQKKPFECPQIPLEGGHFETARLKHLLENMITRDENKRMDWEQLFETFKKQDQEVYIYKPKIRIISITDNKQPTAQIPQQNNHQSCFFEHVTVPCHDFQNCNNDLGAVQKILALHLQKYSFTQKLIELIRKTNLDAIQIPSEILTLYCALIFQYQKILMNWNKDVLYGDSGEISAQQLSVIGIDEQVLTILRNSNEKNVHYLKDQSCKNYEEAESQFTHEYNQLCSFSQQQLVQLSHNLREIYKAIKDNRASKREDIIQAIEFVYKEGKIKTQVESNQRQKDHAYVMVYYLFEKMLRLDQKYPISDFKRIDLIDIDLLPGTFDLVSHAIAHL